MTVASFGTAGPGWAIGATLLATFIVVFLFAVWAAPATLKGVAGAVAIAGVTAILLMVALLALTTAAREVDTRQDREDGETVGEASFVRADDPGL